jgi:Tol biopolymer transport system component
MFTVLFVKEWREKALAFFFELGILALLLGAQFLVREKRDIQEWLIYAVLLLFFPFAGLILGTAGFEAEYRQGAWTYLFSRPMGRISIWLTKFAALLSMFAALWLVFIAAWAVFPWTRELVAGPRLFLNYAAESGFPLWSVGLSAFFLVVSFSLSPLHGRQFNVLFVAVALGLLFPAAARLVLVSRAGGFLAWLDPSRALAAFVLSLVLIALAFAAASILTLVRSDFSQPRRQAASFVRWFTPLLVVAVAVTAVWVRFAPAPGDRYLFPIGSLPGAPCYVTERGVFKYSAPKDRIVWLTRTREANFFTPLIAGGKIVYTAFRIKSRADVFEELWVADADGRGRKCLLGQGPGGNVWPQEVPIADLSVSPDGRRIAILAASPPDRRPPRPRRLLWIINADGSGFEELPDSAGLFGDSSERAYFHVAAWAKQGGALVLWKRGFQRPPTSSLWLYDLENRTARLIHDNTTLPSYRSSLSPGGDRLAIKYWKDSEGPWTLGILDLESLALTDLGDGEAVETDYLTQVAWSPKGDRLAYLVREARPEGSGAYVLRVFSLDDGRVVAEKEMTQAEGTANLLRPVWAADGSALVVFDRDAGSIRILSQELRDVDRITPPRAIRPYATIEAVDHRILVEDDLNDPNILWRVDLKTKRWKRLY